MADWRNRAKIKGDVAYFSYKPSKDVEGNEEVYLWDLDKTYLDTKFETLKGLLRTAMEKGFQKRNVPGTAALVGALQSRHKKSHKNDFPIYFITASPPQMEPKIIEKLHLDGIHPYGVFCKDNLQNVHPKRLWRLTQQVGYKLQALLQLRLNLKEDVRQILFGDDSESDAVIYSLYSDICSRRLDSEEIRGILRSFRVVGSQMDEILRLQNQIPAFDPVEKIYINLANDTDYEYYIKFGRRTLPTYSSFQIAIDLFQDGRLSEAEVGTVGNDLMTNFGYTQDELERGLDDIIRRNVIGEECLKKLLPYLAEQSLIHDQWEPSVAPKPVVGKEENRVYELEGAYEPWVPERIDYLHDYR